MQLDRLPKENRTEGLLLLRSAWNDYDVAIRLATRYKRACKLAFIGQLVLSWAAVASATINEILSRDAAAFAAAAGRWPKGRIIICGIL